MTDDDDNEDHRDNRQQIDLPWIVATGFDIPAHCRRPPREDIKLTVEQHSGSLASHMTRRS
jgi:hypothetical protein